MGRGTGLVSDEWEVRNGEELRMTTTTFKVRDRVGGHGTLWWGFGV